MNSFMTLKTALLGCVLVTSLALTGCNADGDGTVGPGRNALNCDVPLGDICLISGAGSDADDGLLDDQLLVGDGVLADLLDPLDPTTDTVLEALNELLENDGDLANLVENLAAGNNPELALAVLLDGGLKDIFENLGNPETLVDVLGPEGVAGLIETLLAGGDTTNCQAKIATICLIGGNGGKIGLVEALITNNGNLTPIANGNISQDDLVAVLGDLLENPTGGLATLLQGLFQEGNLVEGLQALFDPNQAGSINDALGDALLDQGRDQNIITALLNGLSGLLGTP